METSNSDTYLIKDSKRGVDHIGVTCVFFCHDGKGNILLHKRSAACRDEQGRWDCGAGAMEFGETFEEAVTREIREEYCVEPLELTHVTSTNVLRENNGVKTHWVAILYVAKVDPVGIRIGEPEKIDEIGWFKTNELPEPQLSMLSKHLDLVKRIILKS
ncbi:MAG: NUDIX domain-containing protein [Patescibacteria group bacterium]|nr:NUDIX domain-containing protein [Patescibacteria group bacterium]